jgi:hypothetical protein
MRELRVDVVVEKFVLFWLGGGKMGDFIASREASRNPDHRASSDSKQTKRLNVQSMGGLAEKRQPSMRSLSFPFTAQERPTRLLSLPLLNNLF